ncbi:MAG: hypothetical protein QNK37_32415 [Acidobacteriota bacterium]|nr:hypothetical protein [Acidobacteriota bacterium]
MLKQKGHRGYISSREIDGQLIPQRVQNLVIRDYAARNNLLFLLSAVEYTMDNCYMMLKSLLEEAANIDGIIFYSTHLLPPDHVFRLQIYDTILRQDGDLRFALEEITVKNQSGIDLLEDLIMIREIGAEDVLPSINPDKP